MPIAYRNKTVMYDIPANGVVSKPSGVVAGDILVVAFMRTNSATPITPRASGWTVHSEVVVGQGQIAILSRVAGSAEPASYTFTVTAGTSGNQGGVYMAAYSGAAFVRGAAGDSVTNASAPFPNVNALASADKIVRFGTAFVGWSGATSQVDPSSGSGYVTRHIMGAGNFIQMHAFDEDPDADLGAPTARTLHPGYNGTTPVGTVVLATNATPNAPTLTTLASGEWIDRDVANRASHTFSDPDAGDSQSRFERRHRLIGAATWTTATEDTTNTWFDFPAGSLAVGDYERQVRTADQVGVFGPWSASGFFSVTTVPAAPTITAPTNGSTVTEDATVVSWTAPEQDAYQLQVVDGLTVVHDSGVVEQAATRSASVPFPANNVERTIQLRVRRRGLWSDWYAVTVTVAYTPPAVPVVVLTPQANAAIQVAITNPTPSGSQPAVSHNEIRVDDGGGLELRAKVNPNSSWTYWTPRSGRDYDGRIVVVAVGVDGTRSSS